ncbi:hypothetical protein SAMN05216464_113150 [Mucilaginibacter pineti]|uniref:Conjugal transfer protein TraI n=1 Tax=Mucilaginibacter pineti TaxID=1391627 RepID=A0A1G7ISX0_9SPHI|nr:conjugal transfer protein TraI [Mucilaginibacter pineti]SDF15761.1 hypothetical protein SAMN05216464_113150 [Mucilaginibacter pineti]
MKKMIITVLLISGILLMPISRTQAQIPIINLITAAIKKVIMALDLKVQQLQNKTLALQNAEQNLENSLSLNKLNDISGWLNKEKDLYKGYYAELSTVRAVISGYDEVRTVISQQKQLISEYQQAYAISRRDSHFSPEEISYMGNIYSGILQESLRNLNDLMVAVGAGSQMDDAERLQRVSQATKGMQTNLNHLRQFNRQNSLLSLGRAKDQQERLLVRQLYGLQ